MEKDENNPKFEGLLHGISPERLVDETAYKMITCQYCKLIFWNPQECSVAKCGATFCEPCLMKSLEKEEICTECKSPAKYDSSNFIGNKILAPLKFQCQNHPKCEKILEYKDLPYHFCPFDETNCEIKDCTWKGERKDLDSHVQECPFEIIQCVNEGCTEEMRRSELISHRKICPFEKISCIKACGAVEERGNLENHLKICPFVETNCKYKERGCRVSPIRGEYEKHVDECKFQPKLLECKHTVNLFDVEAHSKDCPQFPLPCPECRNIFQRRELPEHKCLAYILEQMNIMRETFQTENNILRQEITHLREVPKEEANIMRQEITHLRELEQAHEKEIKELKAQIGFCGFCKDLLCRKCSRYIRQLQLIPISATDTDGNHPFSNIIKPDDSRWETLYKLNQSDLIFRVSEDSCYLSKLTIRPKKGCSFDLMRIYLGEKEGKYTFNQEVKYNKEDIVTVLFSQSKMTKCIKLGLIPSSGYIGVHEVKIFGIQT